MAAIPVKQQKTRSKKIRPTDTSDLDKSHLGSFPLPTAWSEQLAVDNLKLAASMASRLAKATKMPFEDLYLVAAMGLLKGCRIYDPEKLNPDTQKPYRLATCVVPYIHYAMAQWLRDKGHSSGVKFPDRWRDVAPVIRRMVKNGKTYQEVADAVGFSTKEVQEILVAQSATSCIGPNAFDDLSFEPNPWYEAETFDELAEALRIADQAHAELCRSDQLALEYTWNSPIRSQLCRLPHGQFLVKVRRIIKAENQSIMETDQQQNETMAPKARKRLKEDQKILDEAQQLAFSLFGDNGKSIGKTSTEGLGVKSATSGNQPSDQQGRAS